METLTRDLHIYEIVLLCLGVFLFLILSIGLVYYIIKKEEIKKLLYFFAIPIIMIGYPSIKEISVYNSRIKFNNYQDALIQNPNDTIAREKLKELTQDLEVRTTTPEDALEISKTKLLLGDPEGAITYAEKAIALENKTTADQVLMDAPDPATSPVIPVNQTLIHAGQLKQLATIQEQAITAKDTSIWKMEFKNINLDSELQKTYSVLQQNIELKVKNAND